MFVNKSLLRSISFVQAELIKHQRTSETYYSNIIQYLKIKGLKK